MVNANWSSETNMAMQCADDDVEPDCEATERTTVAPQGPQTPRFFSTNSHCAMQIEMNHDASLHSGNTHKDMQQATNRKTIQAKRTITRQNNRGGGGGEENPSSCVVAAATEVQLDSVGPSTLLDEHHGMYSPVTLPLVTHWKSATERRRKPPQAETQPPQAMSAAGRETQPPQAMSAAGRETQQTSGLKRTSSNDVGQSLRKTSTSELVQNLSRLQLNSTRSHKKRSSGKQKKKDVYRRLQHCLEHMSSEELTDLFETQDGDGDNLLMISVIEGHTELSVSLVRLVPSPKLLNIRNKLGQTALHLTVITRQFAVCREIVLAGGNLLAVDFKGNTALHVACSNNDMDSVVMLTKLVTSIEIPSRSRRRSLVVPQPADVYNMRGQRCEHIAALNGYTELVKYLTETMYRADVNAAECLAGKTLLHIAAELGNMDLVTYLLARDGDGDGDGDDYDYGTQASALTYGRHSALDLAAGRGQKMVVDVLRRAGVKPGADIMRQIEDEDDEEEEEEMRQEEVSNGRIIQKTSGAFQCLMNGTTNNSKAMNYDPEYDDLLIDGKSVRYV